MQALQGGEGDSLQSLNVTGVAGGEGDSLQGGSELLLGARVALASLLRRIDALEQEVKELDKAVTALSETDRYRAAAEALCDKLTGVAILSAMVFLTELGDMRRFANRRKVGAYLGVVPSSNESGESASDRKGHITRQGPARVRKVLCQSAWSLVAFDPEESNRQRRRSNSRLDVIKRFVRVDASRRSPAPADRRLNLCPDRRLSASSSRSLSRSSSTTIKTMIETKMGTDTIKTTIGTRIR